MAIYFNSKSFKNGFQGLSNLMGGVEFDYMCARFPQQVMKDLFVRLRNCDRETFLEWLQILQPDKKWTPKKLAYWFTPYGEPIRGILAQLLGSMVRRKAGKLTQVSKRRQKVVCEKLGLASIEVVPELSDKNKKAFMKECLRKKYSMEPYHSLLLSSAVDLHEKPLRGNGNNWTYKKTDGVIYGKDWLGEYKKTDGVIYGKDWLGELLMEVRADLAVLSDESSLKRSADVSDGVVSCTKKARVSFKQYVVK
jgi:hypothetical protein